GSAPGSTSSQCLHECLGSFEVRRASAVGNRDQRRLREEVAHPARERGELLVVRAGDQTDGYAQTRQIRTVARLRARAEMAQRAGEPGWTMRKPLEAELRCKRPQGCKGRVPLPAVDELLHPFAFGEGGQVVVGGLPLGSLTCVLAAGR